MSQSANFSKQDKILEEARKLFYLGDFSAAAHRLRQRATRPGAIGWHAQNLLARCLLNQGYFKQAEQVYQEALAGSTTPEIELELRLGRAFLQIYLAGEVNSALVESQTAL